MVKPGLEARLKNLSGSFSDYVEVFNRGGPFSESQLHFHLKALMARGAFPSAAEAVNNPEFADSVREVLWHWRVGIRGTELVPVKAFRAEMAKLTPKLVALEHLQINDVALDGLKTASTIWDLISSMCLVTKDGKPVKNKLVSSSKALHHLLPRLVFPIDREYTQTFFGWRNPEFQNNPRDCFILIFASLADVAKRIHPENLVGEGWMSSPAKILDNAIVGYCVKHALKSESTRYRQKKRAVEQAMEKRAKKLGIWEAIEAEVDKSMADPVLLRVLRGSSDANIRFSELCALLLRLGFAERIKGSHHIFTREGVAEILNLQPKNSFAKPYQVKQVRRVLVQHKLGEEAE